MAKKRKNKKKKQESGGISFIIKKVCIASAVGATAFFILCAAAAFILYRKDADPSCFPAVMLVIGGISGFVCGITAILPIKRNGLVIGMASVIPAFFIIFTAITIINRTAISNIGWAALGIMTFFGGIGGILGNKK